MDQINNLNTNESKDEFWERHINAADSFSGTNRDYCKLNGIDNRKLSYYKKKLGLGKHQIRPKAFIEVKSKSVEEVVVPRETKKSLPDAKWLAEFTLTLLSGHLK